MRSLFFLFTLLASLFVFGQSRTYVGVKAGGHLSSAFLNHSIFNFTAQTTFKSSFHTGFLLKHFPRKRDIKVNTGIQIGANYAQKGWIQTFQDATGLPNYEITLNYLEIPIEGIAYFGGKNNYFLSVGPYVEFLLDVNKDNDPADLTGIDFVTYNANRDHEIGYGGRASGGVFRDFPFGSLHLEAFFTYSFSNFIEAGGLTNDQLPDISNHWNMGLSIGYLLPFGKANLTK